MKRSILLLFIFFSINCIEIQGQITIGNTTVDTTTIASNLEKPWDVIYTADSSIWFTERPGRVSRIDLATNQTHLLLDITNEVEASAESGLMGIAIMDSLSITRVFLVYTYLDSNSTFFERMSKYTYNQTQDTLIHEQVMIDSIPANNYHDGSRLVALNAQIYMSTGDATNTSFPQDLNSYSGKILRFNFDGSVPNDNPVPGSYIYSWGHRNPQGLYYANNMLYSSEHGPTTDDEINIITKGGNYGWPDVHGYCNTTAEINFCNDSNVIEPIFAWTPTVATAGICYYDHPSIPEWQGSILLATLKASRLISLQLNGSKDSVTNTNEYLINEYGRLRDVETNQWGEVFIATNSFPNRIIKLSNNTLSSVEDKLKKDKSIRYFPNPASDKLSIEFNSNAIVSIQLFAINGQEVIREDVKGLTKINLNTSPLKQGLYFLQLKDENDKRTTHKVVISK
ncbi:MAG: PQQ-dependent sugar dehydrogenase [Vicingaceae bacterium]